MYEFFNSCDFVFTVLKYFQMQGDMMEHRGRTSPVMLGTKIPGPQSSPALLGSKQQGAQVRVLTLNHGEHLDSSLFR